MKWNIWCLKVYTNLKTFCHFVLVIFFKFKFEPFSIQKRISFELRSATLESQWWHYHRKSESKEECHSDANWRNMLLNITSSLFTIPCWNVNWKIDKQNMNTMISKQTWIKWHTYRNPFVVAMKWNELMCCISVIDFSMCIVYFYQTWRFFPISQNSWHNVIFHL